MVLFACITVTSIYSQGWVTGGTARIYAVNNNLELAPINVGIGTKTPSAQLHTTGSVLYSAELQMITPLTEYWYRTTLVPFLEGMLPL